MNQGTPYRQYLLYVISYHFLLSRGDKAFPGAHSIHHGGEGKVSEEAVDRMVADLDKQ